jgi:hypothetical protein
VLLAQEQQKAKHLSSIGSPLSPEQGPPASVSQRMLFCVLSGFHPGQYAVAAVARVCEVVS